MIPPEFAFAPLCWETMYCSNQFLIYLFWTSLVQNLPIFTNFPSFYFQKDFFTKYGNPGKRDAMASVTQLLKKNSSRSNTPRLTCHQNGRANHNQVNFFCLFLINQVINQVNLNRPTNPVFQASHNHSPTPINDDMCQPQSCILTGLDPRPNLFKFAALTSSSLIGI